MHIATLNVGTLTSRSCELAAALEDRRIDLYAGNKSKDIGHGFKVVYNGSPKTRNDVGIVVSQRFRDSIAEVQRFDGRLMKVVVTTAEQRLHFFSAYAPQTGCCEQVKDDFWVLLDEKTAEVPMEDTIVVAGDLNGSGKGWIQMSLGALGTRLGTMMASAFWNMLTLTTSSS
ncbi:hypothetical protein Y032_0059g3047 [Ancylostoma ceylanicum]|uniref:Endonuclease/exonuclease/phosphatase domain-containing protein n=1 Tax=Ancylostoma ceylanicum TaxID=53326 RepID=A0A016U4K3_9BILA|nr:hypothetical protein Y032_0059g3047 [Ancylostoma ceylanicum]